MTLQEIFNKVATHLLKQKVQSQLPPEALPYADYPDSTCAYRGAGGTSCAVGCLISDEHYQPSLEGRRVSSSMVRNALGASGVPLSREATDLLGTLQTIHDSYQPHAWPRALQTLADSHNLEMPK